MKCFADVEVARVYHSPKDDILTDLLTPMLEHAISIRRSTGDVQSATLALYRTALADFLERNPGKGIIRWLSGNRLGRTDVEAIRHREAYIVSNLHDGLRNGPSPGRESEWAARILATLLDKGILEWKVVVTNTKGVYHEKVAIFSDECGHQALLSGSWNETVAGYTRSIERVDVHSSLDDPYRCADASNWFDKVWNGNLPGINVMSVEQAVENAKFVIAEEESFSLPPRSSQVSNLWTPELLFLAIQDKVPPELRDPFVGTLVSPLPHQIHIHHRILSRQPTRFLLADEVGLGKTIEAGMFVSTMASTGHAGKVLILAPKNVMDQWHQELWEKFQLPSWKLENGRWKDDYGKREQPASEKIFDYLPGTEPHIVLVSRSIAMRTEWIEDIKSTSWDIVILDEAHRARSRKVGNRYRQNKLLVALDALSERTNAMLLLTATPVQLGLFELFDLLSPLGLPLNWRDRDKFSDFVNSLSEKEPDWNRLFDLAAESENFYLDRFGLNVEDMNEDLKSGVRFFSEARGLLDPEIAFNKALNIIRTRAAHSVYDLSDPELKLLRIALYRMSPIYQLTCRTTRSLLRKYRDLGIIHIRIPTRVLEEPLEVDLSAEEATLYDDVRDEYLKPFYQMYSRTGLSRNNVGFVLTIYAKRAASSWAALRKSLGRRLDRVNLALNEWEQGGIYHLFGKQAIQSLASEKSGESEWDVELEGYEDALEIRMTGIDVDEVRRVAELEKDKLEDLLLRLVALKELDVDSKRTHITTAIRHIVTSRKGLLVFSQFKDTVDDLADSLIDEYGQGLAKYHGSGGELWNGTEWVQVDKATVENRVKNGKVRVLIATDAASEGLDLQALDSVMSYDLPWNPMRIEQRIGRVDRLNQSSATISVYTVLSRGTIEETVYKRCVERIGLFRDSMGPLQPILIEDYVKNALLQGENVSDAIDSAIVEWSTARKHTELLEEALSALVPTHEWGRSREVERRTLQALLENLGFRQEGQCWRRDDLIYSIQQPLPGTDILTAAPSNKAFEKLITELGTAPKELHKGPSTYRLLSCRSAFAFTVNPSPDDGWYIIRDITKLDGRDVEPVGKSEADVRAHIEELVRNQFERLRMLQDSQKAFRREKWRGEVTRRVWRPILRLVSMDYWRAAEEIMRRAPLKTLWAAFIGINSEFQLDDLRKGLMEIPSADLRGKKKNMGLIVVAANELLKMRP